MSWMHPAPVGPLSAGFRLNGSSPQAAGLQAWWPTAQQAGLVLRDYSNHIASAAFPAGAAAPVWVGAPGVERALSFDGSAQYVDTGKSFSQANLNPVTVSCWLKRLASAAGDYLKAAVAQDAASGGRAFALGIQGDVLDVSLRTLDAAYIEVAGDGGTNYLRGTAALTLNVWYHLAWTFDGSTHTLYVNGQSVASAAVANMIAPPAATTTCTIGRRNYSGFEAYFNGHIADVRVYSSALAAAIIYHMWALPTRWDLYWPPRRVWDMPAPVYQQDRQLVAWRGF